MTTVTSTYSYTSLGGTLRFTVYSAAQSKMKQVKKYRATPQYHPRDTSFRAEACRDLESTVRIALVRVPEWYSRPM